MRVAEDRHLMLRKDNQSASGPEENFVLEVLPPMVAGSREQEERRRQELLTLARMLDQLDKQKKAMQAKSKWESISVFVANWGSRCGVCLGRRTWREEFKDGIERRADCHLVIESPG